MLFQISSLAPSATPADSAHMQVEDHLEMIARLRVFKLPNFEGRGEPALGFWWHINPHVTYKNLKNDVAGLLPRQGSLLHL